jgi:hypothetical protein
MNRVNWVNLCLLFAASAVSAQSSTKPPSSAQGASHAAIAKLPDWSGTWAMPDRAFLDLMKVGASAPFKPDYAAKARAKTNSTSCLPTGMPGIMALPIGYEFLFTPGRVTILAEEGPLIRRVYTDGRAHAEDPEPTYAGDSVGHWEGSTLIVDTIAIKPQAEFVNRLKTSGQTRVIERISLTDPTHMRIDSEIHDPIALTGPWRYSVTYQRSDTGFVESYYCDNDRDSRGEPDLQPPAKGKAD